MTDWVRLWHDMPTDPKWRSIARRSAQPLACVIAVFNLVLVNASANQDGRGSLSGWDSEDAANALDMEPDAVEAIIAAMQGKVLDGDRLTGWEKRQPKREDGTAAERKAAWKQRKNAVERSGTQENAPETETETETDITSSLRSDVERASAPAPIREKPSRKKGVSEGEAILIEAGCPESLIADWKSVRKAKNAGPITETVANGICREAVKAGLTVRQAVTASCERGWQGFKADWIDRPNAAQPRPPPSHHPPRRGSAALIDALREIDRDERAFGQRQPDGPVFVLPGSG